MYDLYVSQISQTSQLCIYMLLNESTSYFAFSLHILEDCIDERNDFRFVFLFSIFFFFFFFFFH
ncbi:uncharacterized protein V2V93DRAFT_373489 [Kockiozyma suomiensis]|uniref:uncharacterized protein n=1 Tax=Kockiozyma suomiensis TaxID=1337062 RepID=UPI003343CFB7